MGGRTPGSVRSTHSSGESLGASLKKMFGNLGHLILDFLCRLPLLGRSYILSPFYPYIVFMPVQFLICALVIYKVHYCI